MTSDCNPVHKPLSQTLPWSPPWPPVTDGVYRGNFHHSRCLLMLIVKSVWDVPGSFITWRHNGNLHFIRMPSSAHGSWLAKGHSLEQGEQRSEVLSVPEICGRTSLVPGAPLLRSARARPSSTWIHVTECGGSSSEVPCRLAGCVCPSRCIVQAFMMGAEGPYPLGTQYTDRVHSTTSPSAIARKCHGLMGHRHQTAHCRELTACNRTEMEKPVPQLQASRGVTVKETSTGPLQSSRSPDNPLVNNSIN